MSVQNADISAAFNELADLLEIQGANPFRVRAYRNAARVIESWPRSLEQELKSEHELPGIPGVGKDLAGKIEELLGTGHLSALDEVRRKLPRGMVELLRVPSLGPKRVRLLYDRLGIRNLPALKRAVGERRIRELPGFGPLLETKISEALGESWVESRRIPLAQADARAGVLVEFLRGLPGVSRCEAAGSLRRRLETVGDIDLLAVARDGARICHEFCAHEDVARVISEGTTRSTVVLRSGVQVDLRVVPAQSFGAALHYFTGSKAHNIAIRSRAQGRGLKINEYGVFRGTKRIAGKTEREVFRSVGLPFIEPELREDRGEIQAAERGELPELLALDEIRGDLHAHTRATDGRQSAGEMALAAQAMGYGYLAITDHSRSLKVTRGLDRKRLLAQWREIDRLNAKLSGFRILKSSEVEILEDGGLDFPDELLCELDLTICSVHSAFDLPAKKQTERILRAMDHPCFHVLGHPTGRLIQRRPELRLDFDRLARGASERGCFFEINAQPERMDLPDRLCLAAKSFGAKFVVSTDAHQAGDLKLMRYGVAIARRGWLTPKDVLNTRSLKDLRRLLKK